jgi:carboxyl-terminal processing protease
MMIQKQIDPRNISRQITIFILMLGAMSFGYAQPDDGTDVFLKIYRGIDTYGKVYKEIALNYADTLDPDAIMRSGIDGMLKSLDPYTVYIGFI